MWSSVESGGSNGRAAPCARGKHSATLLGGHVYVLGGRGAGGAVPLRDFWSYSLGELNTKPSIFYFISLASPSVIFTRLSRYLYLHVH